MSKSTYGDHVYDIDHAQIAKVNEAGTPVPQTAPLEPIDVTAWLALKNDLSPHYPVHPLREFRLELTSMDTGFLDTLFPKPVRPDHILRVNGDGLVETYMRIYELNGNYVEGWYYFNLLDGFMWRYSIQSGMQLDDACAELSRQWGAIHLNVNQTREER